MASCAEDTEETGPCWLLELMPPELLVEIFAHVVGLRGHVVSTSPSDAARDLAAWCGTCSTFNALCDDELRYRSRCFAAQPVLFGLALSPLFGGRAQDVAGPARPFLCATLPSEAEDSTEPSVEASGDPTPSADQPLAASSGSEKRVKLTWQLRAQLLRFLPRRLIWPSSSHYEAEDAGASESHVIDQETGLVHTNVDDMYYNLLADLPFVSTNMDALKAAFAAAGDATDDRNADEAAERAFLDAVMFSGVDYFEVTVVNNTPSFNQAAAIAISQVFKRISFLGWTSTSIAFHSDDGTIRGGEERSIRSFVTFSTGDVVGCGVDWDQSEIFFVVHSKNAAGEPNTKIYLEQRPIPKVAWYPAIGSMMQNDVLRANFGREPFAFDVKQFIDKKRARALASLPPTINFTIVGAAAARYSRQTRNGDD